MAVIAGVRPGIWKTAEPMPMREVVAAIAPNTLAASRAVGLGYPDHVVSELICGNRQPQVVLQLRGRSHVAQIESESHGR